MRKFLLSAVALMVAVTMMAAGAGDGSSKANAIDFAWVGGHKPALSAGSWYRVSLSPLKAEANDPTLALYLTNLTDETAAVTVTVEASLLGQSSSSKFNYNIAAKDYQLWSKKSFVAGGRELSLKQMMDLGLSEIYLQLTSNKEIALSAKVYETEDIVDDACSKAKDFTWAGVNIPVGEQWFRLNLSEVKNNNKKLNFVITNQGAVEANVSFEMSLDCPASAVLPAKNWTIAAGAEEENELGTIFLDVLNEDYVFVKLINDQPITMRVEEEVVVVDPSLYADFDCATAPELVFGEEMNLTAGKHVYKVKREELIAERDFDTEFYVTNNTSEVANLTVETAFACPVTSVVAQNLVINAQESIMKLVKGDMLKAVNSEWVYIRFITDKDLTASVGMRNVSPCANAVVFDWNTGAELQAGESQWYEVDITTLKQNKQHLYLAFANHSKATALVNLELAMDCQGTILPLVLPVPAGFDLGQTIDYQILSRSPLNRIYVGVSTDSHIELSASTKDAIAADPTPCLNALNPEHGKEYKHAAGTTSWYKISLDLLKSKAGYSSIYLANPGNKRANVTIGMVTDCQYTTGATITLPIPAGFNLGMLAPNVIGNLVDALARVEKVYNKVDAKDVYLEIKTDQDILFGLDVTNATTNPCLREDLITFDWANGAKVTKGDAKWFDMDLNTVKQSGKHVKLTFTNHTDSIVWAVTVVSVDCPAKLTMPLVVPVPAGMSIDKLIDYSFFAAVNLDNIYIGVLTDGELELGASMVEATLTTPPADCTNATVVTSDEEYIQNPGTKWYKFPMSLVDEMTSPASFSIKNMGTNHATLTAGVTVGCEYAIATRGKMIVPEYVDMTLNMPKRVVTMARKLIDVDVNDFYLQLTTDQPIAFSMNTRTVDVRVCGASKDFDWNAWKTTGLQLGANEDTWYKVNLGAPLQQLKNGEDIVLSVSNPNSEAIDVDFSVSPTCPVALSFNGSVSIPGNMTVQKVLAHDDVMRMLVRMDNFVYNSDTDLWIERVETNAFLNKLKEVLSKYGYEEYVPYDRIESLVDKYGVYISFTGAKDLFDSYEKYLSRAEVERLLEKYYKEYVNIETAKKLFDNYGEYIPSKVVEKALENYDKLIPFAGGAKVMVDKCKQYISKDDLKSVINRCEQYVPVEEMKQLYKRLVALIPDEKAIYLNLKSEGDLIVEPDTVPETPAGCEAATLLDWTKVVNLSELPTGWYKCDVSSLHATRSDFTLKLNNDMGEVKALEMSLFLSCDEPFVAKTKKTFQEGLNSSTIAYSTLTQYAGQVDVLYFYILHTDAEVKDPEGCLSAVDYVFGQDISLKAGDDLWYAIDVAAIRAMQKNMKVTVTNASDVAVNLTLELAFECPVTKFETQLEKLIEARTSYTEVVTVETLEAHADVNTAYLHVVSTGDLTINVAPDTTVVPVPEACELGDTIVWTSGMTLQIAEAVDKWYTVDISEASANKYDVKITVENNTGVDVNATIDVYTTCPVGSAVRSATQTIYSYSETTKKVMYDQYSKHNTDWLYIHVTTSGSLDVSSEHIVYPKTYEHDTITKYVCDGNAFVDPITNDSVLISSLIADVFEWNDTVPVSPTLDSVYTFVVTPVVAPVKMNDSILATITSAIPVLKQGELPSVDASAAAIKDYYENNDTEKVSDVPNVTWKHATGIIPCDATTYTMTLVVEDECDNVLETTFVFNVEARTVTETTTPATVCHGGSYHWDITGKDYSLAGEYRDTLRTANGCDSIIYTLNLTVLPDVVYETPDTATVCFGETYTWRGAARNASASDTLKNSLGCDSIIYTLNLTVLPAVEYAPVENAKVCFGETYTWRGAARNASASDTLKNSLGCDSIIYTLNLTVLPDVVYETPDTATVCFGETYTWRGEARSVSASDTLKNSLGCDSIIYTLNLTVLPDVVYETPDTATVCFGETYTWRGAARNASASDTLKNSLGCDSIIYTLNLTVLPEAKVETEEWTLCPGDLSTPRDWHGQSISAAGNYEAIEKFAGTDCDSVIYQLTVIIPDADNNVTMDNLPAVSKYNNRIIMLNLNEIKDMFGGWSPAEADVQWFRVVGTQDAAYAAWNKLGDDEPLAMGHYYNLLDGGTLPAGQYYALLWRSSDVCEGGEIMRTILITCDVDASGPRLVPNVVRANETLTLENLNPSDVNEIRVYSSTGQLVATYTAEQVSKFIFNAATVSGYYLVDVENNNNKVTLRYVVK